MDIHARIAARVHALRQQRGLSLEALAARCDVSRSMLSLIERGQSNATAVVLEKIATALGVPLAALFDEPATQAAPLLRRAEQQEWRDPQSGYLRRNLSPPDPQSPLKLVEVVFPPHASVTYETAARDVRAWQQIWLLQGQIEVAVGKNRYRLDAGDCLAFELDQPTAFHNPHPTPARYLVALASPLPLP